MALSVEAVTAGASSSQLHCRIMFCRVSAYNCSTSRLTILSLLLEENIEGTPFARHSYPHPVHQEYNLLYLEGCGQVDHDVPTHNCTSQLHLWMDRGEGIGYSWIHVESAALQPIHYPGVTHLHSSYTQACMRDVRASRSKGKLTAGRTRYRYEQSHKAVSPISSMACIVLERVLCQDHG